MGKNNSWGFELPNSFLATQNTLKNMTASFETINGISRIIPLTNNLSGAYAAVNSFQSVLNNIYSDSTFATLTNSCAAMQSAFANIQIPTVADMIPTIEKVLPSVNAAWDINSIDWDWMYKTLVLSDDYDDRDDVEELLTDEIREEINESVCDALTTDDSQKNIEQRYGEWKEKHPLLADIYLQLVAIFLSAIFGLFNNWITGLTTKNSKVYELPASASNVIVNVVENQNVTIINEVPYYYEVIYTDPETGEEKKGYIYKPNVAIQPNDSEIQEINDNIE